jgi:hypothetical protein
MNKLTQAALVAVAIAFSAGTMTHVAPAQAADVSVQFDAGNVAFGYSDGYWDRAHAWHPWPNEAARTDWQSRNRAHYFEQRHDQVAGAGWRDTDHWWH